MGKKLLVADDSVTIQKVIKLALSSEGYDILAVPDGHDALRAIEEENPDLVLVDIALPGKNAFELRKELKADDRFKGVGVILMVSAFEKLDEQLIQELQFHGRLIKPFDPAHLRKVVSQALEKAQNGFSELTRSREINIPPPVREVTSELHIDPPPSALPPTFDLSPEDQQSSASAPPMPPSSPPPAPEESDEITSETSIQRQDQEIENDIRGLTESTIKLSGLDEMEWNLDDSSKLKAGESSEGKSAPPAPPAAPQREVTKPTLVPPTSVDDGGSNFFTGIGKESTVVRESVAAIGALTGATMTRKEVEDMIRRELKDSFEKIARDELPLIAERIIRKEIEKILSEP